MILNCKNNCKIKGNEDNVRKLYTEITNKGYDMNKHITLNNPENIIEKGAMWGIGTKIVLECSMFSNENPVEFTASFLTDGPIEQFWRHMSAKFNVEIEYSFYNDNSEFIGIHNYKNGLLLKSRYDENPNSEYYKELVLQGGFELPEVKTAPIISFNELLERGKK